MAEIKDFGREFRWSRPRIMGLLFSAVSSPIFLALALLGHETLGGVLWFATCIGLTIAYVRPTRFRNFMQRVIPTSAERGSRSPSSVAED